MGSCVASKVPQRRGWADDNAAVRPDLYVDGAALADRVAHSVRGGAHVLDHHVWPSALFRLYMGDAFFPADDPARLALHDWLMAQPDDSVAPDALYVRAIAAAGGNVERGLAIAWDVLREDWDDGQRRNEFPRTRKLIDITGERGAFRGNACGFRSSTIRGDNFSAWYHMTGTALLTFLNANGSLSAEAADTFTNAMITIEETFFGHVFVDSRKREAIDRAGAAMGRRLAENLQRRVAGDPQRPYLYDNPSLYGPSWRMPASGRACDFREDGLVTRAAKRLNREPPNPARGLEQVLRGVRLRATSARGPGRPAS